MTRFLCFLTEMSSSGSKCGSRLNHSLKLAWRPGNHERKVACLVLPHARCYANSMSLNSLTAILYGRHHLNLILLRKTLRGKVSYQRWHDHMARKRWSQGLNSVVQAKSLGVVLDSCFSHTPHPVPQSGFAYPKQDLLPPSVLPPQTLPSSPYTWIAPFVPIGACSDLPVTSSHFTFPFFTDSLSSWLPWNPSNVSRTFLSSGSCSSWSLCLECASLDSHLRTPSQLRVIVQNHFSVGTPWFF